MLATEQTKPPSRKKQQQQQQNNCEYEQIRHNTHCNQRAMKW